MDVTGLTSGVQSIAKGDYHVCALTTLGAIKCWGYNNLGQLGNGTTTNSSVPVNVTGLSSGVSAIRCFGSSTYAVMSDGTVKSWGYNGDRNLGDGTNAARSVPVDVIGLTGPVADLTLTYSVCARLTSGHLECWGQNDFGQLGLSGSYYDVLSSFQIAGTVATGLAPLAGANLTLTSDNWAPGASDSSDGAGSYSLQDVGEDTSYTLTPSLTGYSFSPPSVTAVLSADVTHDFVATLNTYNITGNVTVGGSAQAGVTVDGGALGTRLTDGSGAYSFLGIDHGTAYTLTVSQAGVTFGVDTASGTLTGNATHDFAGTVNTYDLTGIVLVGGVPLAGVNVDGGALGSVTTDVNGAYSFSAITHGTSYTVMPSLASYSFTPVSSSGSLTATTTHDFAAVYNPPSTSVVTTTSSTTTTEPTTTVQVTTTGVTTTVATSTTATESTTPSTTSVGDDPSTPTTTIETGGTSTISLSTTSVNPTTTTLGSEPLADSDSDGVTDTDELTVGTNPKDPGSKAPKLRTTICSEWNGYLGGSSGRGMYNIMEHMNLTTKKLRVKTELRSIRGHLKDTYEFFLRGNQQFDLLVHDFSGRETNSYGQVCTTYNGAPVGSLDGRMVYYKFAADGGIQFAFALPFENPTLGSSALLFNTQQPSLDPKDSENLVANWVQLSNVSRKRLKGTLSFHALDGSILGTYDVNLRDGARYDYSAHAWGRSAGLVRFAPQDNKVEYQLRGVRYLYDNSGATDSFASAYPFAATVGSGETLIAPVDAGAGTPVLELSNTLAKKVSVTVALYDQTGKKRLYSKNHVLKAYNSEHLQLSPLLANSTGLLTAKSSHTGSIIGSVVHYGRTSSQGVLNMYAIPLHEPILPSIKGSYNTYLNQGCTLYLSNASASNQKVTISMRQNDGTKPVKDYNKTVPGRGVIAEDICSKSPSNVYGVVAVTASKPKRIYGVVVRNGEGGRYKMATDLR